MGTRLTEIFLLLFCEKNSNGTKTLILKGKDLYQRIGKRLISTDMNYICDFLQKHREVNQIKMPYNDIGDAGLEILIERILSHKNSLKSLNLAHCDLTKEGMKNLYFCSVMGYLKFKTLRLYGNKIGYQGAYALALMMQYCTTIEHLDIGDTDQTPDSINNLFYGLYKTEIKILNISRTIPNLNLCEYDSQFLAQSLQKLLGLNQHIKELNVEKCGLDGHDIEILIEGLERNNSLVFLNVAYNRISDLGAELLANWLKQRPKLLGLNVAGNNLTSVSACTFRNTIPFSRLRLLNISYNRMDDEGLYMLLISIKKSTQMRFLYMWGNDFGPQSLKLIEQMLRSGVLVQGNIDVKIYVVDGILCAARYDMDHFKHRYYDVMDHGCPVELKIIRNQVEKKGEKPRALVKFQHTDRFPPLK